jgi:hypothetical protein
MPTMLDEADRIRAMSLRMELCLYVRAVGAQVGTPERRYGVSRD